MRILRFIMLWVSALCAVICGAETFSYNGSEYRTVEDTAFGKSVALVSFGQEIPKSGELVMDSQVYMEGDDEPYNVVRLENSSITNPGAVRSITLPANLIEIGMNNINELSMLEKIEFGNHLEAIEDFCFWELPNLKEISFPQSLKHINEGCFEAVGLTRLTIDLSDFYIMGIAFRHLPDLETLELVNIWEIGNSVFCDLPKLKRVVIPKGCYWIYPNSFQELPSLEDIVFADNKDLKILSSAFQNCPAVKRIYFEGSEPPQIESEFEPLSGEGEYSLDFKNITLYVPYGSKETYESNNRWNIFGSIVEYDPAGIDEVGDDAINLNDKAPVEYFNLQGVRVANPAAGELVIKRQGDKVSKTFFN